MLFVYFYDTTIQRLVKIAVSDYNNMINYSFNPKDGDIYYCGNIYRYYLKVMLEP